MNGIEFALKQGVTRRRYTIAYTSLNDATRGRRPVDGEQTSADAARLPRTRRPSTTWRVQLRRLRVSIPILNDAGIAQDSPANTYVGLTASLRRNRPGEPNKYYPTGKRTYTRIVPIDTIQGAADLDALSGAAAEARDLRRPPGLRRRPCGSAEGHGHMYGIRSSASRATPQSQSDYTSVAQSFASGRAMRRAQRDDGASAVPPGLGRSAALPKSDDPRSDGMCTWALGDARQCSAPSRPWT